MKKLTLLLLGFGFYIFLSACQENSNTKDTAKIQESIDKIKCKIQESAEKSLSSSPALKEKDKL
jgi:hypothetical protein